MCEVAHNISSCKWKWYKQDSMTVLAYLLASVHCQVEVTSSDFLIHNLTHEKKKLYKHESMAFFD